MKPRNHGKPWTPEDDADLRQLYPHHDIRQLMAMFGREEKAVQARAHRLGLRKAEGYVAPQLNTFQKGHATWNKGMKGLDIGGKATRFQKGRKPHTWRPIGHVRVSKEGYLQRKVTDTGYPPRDWRPVHHLIWEEHTGQPVPEGHALVFRDGNRRNFDPANLELVSRADLMRRNTYLRFPQPLREVVQLKGALNRMINNRSKQHEDECQ